MTNFDDIRPYRDEEVRPTLDRLVSDNEFVGAVTRLRFPTAHRFFGWLLEPLVRSKLSSQLGGINDIRGFQSVVEQYMTSMMEKRVGKLTVSGLDKLDKHGAYLFISNHRDIAMDPAFVNWVLFHAGCNTLRIAIGDNLLTKPFASDLMRLNKSFIVNRSAKAPREKLKAAKHLSAYIHHSIVNENSNIWIAQREGRAKDGNDKTNSAVLGMLMLNKPKEEAFGEYLEKLRIVPVSISYELDPCDSAKARELYLQRTEGSYQKEEHEDVRSIAMGIAGDKGNVHLAFGDVFTSTIENADALVNMLDKTILSNYVLHVTNCIAYEILYGNVPAVSYGADNTPYDPTAVSEARASFEARMAAIPKEHRDIALGIYANPVVSKLTGC